MSAVFIILVVAGLALLLAPPQGIQNWYGYRTPAAMSSKRRWDVANRLGAYLLLGLGVVLGLAYWLLPDTSVVHQRIELALGICVLVAMIVIEIYLRSIPKDGGVNG